MPSDNDITGYYTLYSQMHFTTNSAEPQVIYYTDHFLLFFVRMLLSAMRTWPGPQILGCDIDPFMVKASHFVCLVPAPSSLWFLIST